MVCSGGSTAALYPVGAGTAFVHRHRRSVVRIFDSGFFSNINITHIHTLLTEKIEIEKIINFTEKYKNKTTHTY